MEKGNGSAAMKYGKSIVNELLISYENSANFSGSTEYDGQVGRN